MRVDIDHKDVADLFAETERRRPHARETLALWLSALAMIIILAAFFAWQAALAIAAMSAETPSQQFLALLASAPQTSLSIALSTVAIILSIATGIAILHERKKETAIRRDEFMRNTLISGRFDYVFTPEMLVIKGAQSVRKICWSTLSAMENAKNCIIFRHKDGAIDSIPKNVFPNIQFGDALLVKHEKSVNKPCPLELANNATPLCVTFEETAADYADYRRLLARRRDGGLHFLRRLGEWSAWPPYLFLAFSALAIALAFVAFKESSLQHAGMATTFVLAAIFVFRRNSDFFRGAAFPFRKNETWPYAQSDLVTVQLTRDGVRRQRHGAVELIRWAAIETYIESRLYGYFVISPGNAIALPKRAFISAAHFNDFKLRAKACITNAKSEQAARKQQRLVGSIGGKSKAIAAKPAKTAAIADMRPAKKKAPAGAAAQPAKTSAA